MFESAGDPDQQRAFLTSLASHFDADSASLLIWPEKSQPLLVVITAGANPDELQAAFHAQQSEGNLFSELAVQQNGSVTGFSAFPGFGACHGLAALLNTGNDNIALTLTRGTEKTAFGNHEQARLSTLVPYFQRAVEHYRLFSRTRHSAAAGLFLFERAQRGILIFGLNGRVTYSNQEAKRMLADGDGMSLANDFLEMTHKEAALRLRLYIAGAAAAKSFSEFSDLELESALLVERDSGKAPYQMALYALPIGLSEVALDEKRGLVAAMIHDPEHKVAVSHQTLSKFLGLTPAETKLANTLLHEHQLTDAAASIGISINTARTQLKSIFLKLGVNSQPALMQRLTRTLDIRSPDRPAP